MPDKKSIARAAEDRREGKAPSTHAGEFVREETHHIRSGKHRARSAKQAIAIGLSKARRAGVKLPSAALGHDAAGRRPARETAVAATRAGACGGAQARRPRCRLDERAQATGPSGGGEGRRQRPLGVRAPGGTHQGASRTPRRGTPTATGARPFLGLVRRPASGQASYLNDSCTRAR